MFGIRMSIRTTAGLVGAHASPGTTGVLRQAMNRASEDLGQGVPEGIACNGAATSVREPYWRPGNQPSPGSRRSGLCTERSADSRRPSALEPSSAG